MNNEPIFFISGVPVDINDLSNRRDIVPYMARLNAVLDLIEGMLDNADEVPRKIRINSNNK